MIARYIDIEEFFKQFSCTSCTDDIIEYLQEIPTADVEEVKHGHFIRNERNIPKMKVFHEKGYASSMNTKSIFWTCSCCGSWASLIQKYCHECGAKMDGGKGSD